MRSIGQIYIKSIMTLAGASIILGGGISNASAQGTITLKGSDTMLQLAQVWAEAYHKAKGRIVTVTGGGSSTGIAALVNGSTDIANASRSMKGSEIDKAKERGFVPFEVPVARDGLSIVVNPKNPVKSLSIDQLNKIYSGQISNWKQVGGANQVIITIGRDSSSGTYGFFQDNVLKGGPYRSDMQTTPSNNAIAQVVSQDAGAIGYIGVAYAKAFAGKVKEIPVSRGTGPAEEPTEANVRSGKYPLWRYLFMYTRGKPSGATSDFINWVKSKEGQEIVEKVGYYSIK